MQLSDFNYDLPEELIARFPLAKRSESRLLGVDRASGELTHGQFKDIIDYLSPNDLLICNNTKVIPARLFGQKVTGGRIEMLVERILDNHRILALVRSSKSSKPGSLLTFAEQITFEVLGRKDELFELKCLHSSPVIDLIEQYGELPLPHYFDRKPNEDDNNRYQTIFAAHKGSVAAPTAGLHFDDELFQAIKAKGTQIAYVTLHIGAGTFAPVRVTDITTHKMHSEYVQVSDEVCQQIKLTKARGGNVIAVGTTSLRSLETAALSGEMKPYAGDTDIFIYPGFEFKCVDSLITNLHLPGSTLLMLVAAFAGYEVTMKAYREAVQQKYRFFSYGDAMLIRGT